MPTIQILSLCAPLTLSGALLVLVLKFRWLAFLNLPLDCYASLGGQRVFGKNKTVKGALVYIGGGVCFSILLSFGSPSWIHPLIMNSPISLGLVSGLFYTLGEMGNSFVKRRMGIPEGQCGSVAQRIADLCDGVVLSSLSLFFFFGLSEADTLQLAIAGVLIHLTFEYAMRTMGIGPGSHTRSR